MNPRTMGRREEIRQVSFARPESPIPTPQQRFDLVKSIRTNRRNGLSE
jgi:hypothetical protein